MIKITNTMKALYINLNIFALLTRPETNIPNVLYEK